MQPVYAAAANAGASAVALVALSRRILRRLRSGGDPPIGAIRLWVWLGILLTSSIVTYVTALR